MLAAWGLAALVLVLAVAAHVFIAARLGEQSFDNAVAGQFAYLLLHGGGASGIVGASAFGDHFNPIYVLGALAYWVVPSTVTLQVLKCAVYASILPAVYLLARDLLGGDSGQNETRAGLVAACVVALSPLFVVSLLADYHTETLAAGLLPWMLLAYQRERLGACLVLAALVALGKENLPLVVGGLGILALTEKRGPRWWLALGGIGAAVFVLGVFVVIPAATPQDGNLGALLYSRLGTSAGWGRALGDSGLYAWLGVLALSCGGLFLFAPRALWPVVPLLLQHGLSARAAERVIDYHYLAPVLPLLAYASLVGLSGCSVRRRRLFAGALVALNGILLVGVAGAERTEDRGPGPGRRLAGLQDLGPIDGLFEQVPAGAPAWASMATAARLAARERLYLVESLSSGTYMGRAWRFDREAALRDPPAYGLIDARDRGTQVLPPGLHAVSAVGDLVLLARRGPAVVKTVIPSGEWIDVGDCAVQGGVGGRYRVRLEESREELPLVELRLTLGEETLEASRAHRLLLGQARQAGCYEVRYTHPRARPGAVLHARLGGRWVVLSSY